MEGRGGEEGEGGEEDSLGFFFDGLIGVVETDEMSPVLLVDSRFSFAPSPSSSMKLEDDRARGMKSRAR